MCVCVQCVCVCVCNDYVYVYVYVCVCVCVYVWAACECVEGVGGRGICYEFLLISTPINKTPHICTKPYRSFLPWRREPAGPQP